MVGTTVAEHAQWWLEAGGERGGTAEALPYPIPRYMAACPRVLMQGSAVGPPAGGGDGEPGDGRKRFVPPQIIDYKKELHTAIHGPADQPYSYHEDR